MKRNFFLDHRYYGRLNLSGRIVDSLNWSILEKSKNEIAK
jgi:hypothetical protein